MVGDVDEFALRIEHRRERVAGADGDVVRSEGADHTEGAVLRVTHHIESIAETHSEDLDRPACILVGLIGGILRSEVGFVAVERRVVQKGHPFSSDIVHQLTTHREVEANAFQEVPARRGIGGNHRLGLPTQEKLGIAGVEARIERGEGGGHGPGTAGAEFEGIHPLVHGRAQLGFELAGQHGSGRAKTRNAHRVNSPNPPTQFS